MLINVGNRIIISQGNLNFFTRWFEKTRQAINKFIADKSWKKNIYLGGTRGRGGPLSKKHINPILYNPDSKPGAYFLKEDLDDRLAY